MKGRQGRLWKRLTMRAGAIMLAGFGLAVIPAPALAQYGAPPPPPPQDYPTGPSARAQPPEPSSLVEVLRAAACLVRRDAAAGQRLLATAPYSDGERDEAVRTLRAAERCMRSRDRIGTSAMVLRGAVAESLYETEFAQPPQPLTPSVAAAGYFRPDAATTRDDAAGLAPAYALADCTAAGQPELVRALLAAEPDAAEEAAALQALNPAFTACVTAGTQIQLDRNSIRAILAESLYRWAVVQRDGAGSPLAAATAASN